MKIFTKSPFEVPKGWNDIVADYETIPVPVPHKTYDTCDGCVFADSILCMGKQESCEGIIFKVHCDD